MQISKYSANGNDFVIFHTFTNTNRSELAKKLCNRFNGIGADGLIVLLPHKKYDFEWQFYNADGSTASMCGNGSRAAAHYAHIEGLAKNKMRFLTGAGVISAVVDGDVVESELTKPIIINNSFEEEGRIWFFVDTGVPHLVTEVQDIDDFDRELASRMRYRHNANVNFVTLKNNSLHVRTYERGVENETMACGTGMAACFLYMYLNKKVKESSKVYPSSKEELVLKISKEKLYLKGAVIKTFELVKNINFY